MTASEVTPGAGNGGGFKAYWALLALVAGIVLGTLTGGERSAIGPSGLAAAGFIGPCG